MNRKQVIKLLSQKIFESLTIAEKENYLASQWNINYTDSEYHDLPKELQIELKTFEEFDNPDDIKYKPLILKGIAYEFKGVKNSYIESKLRSLGILEKVSGNVEKLFKCPCCEFKTLTEKSAYDICPICFWEDSGSDLNDHSGPNRMTLRNAIDNFKKYGACTPDSIRFVDKEGYLKFEK